MDNKKKTILFVDDDSDIRALVQQLLGDKFHIIEMATANSAWSALQGGLKPDLLITDLHMPAAASNGYWLIGQVKAEPRLADMPIIIMSADGYLADVAHATGVADYIALPADNRHIMATVDSVLFSAGAA
jgi:CheY-like chemotaxis protein